jgi:hypothetical protein
MIEESPMPCAALPLPSLLALLDELAKLDAAHAADVRPQVVQLAEQLDAARDTLIQEVRSIAQVLPDGRMASWEEWCMRSWHVAGARRKVRELVVDEDCLREQLERALFLGRQMLAVGKRPCPACQGAGEGPPFGAGTSVYTPPCEACAGTGTTSSV